MKELFSSLFDSYKERLKNRLAGSFIIFFIAYNWKAFFYFLFSNDTIKEKFLGVDSYYVGFWTPVIYTILYTSFLPILNALVEWIGSIGKIMHLNTLDKIEKREMWLLFITRKRNELQADDELTSEEIRKAIIGLRQEDINAIAKTLEKNALSEKQKKK